MKPEEILHHYIGTGLKGEFINKNNRREFAKTGTILTLNEGILISIKDEDNFGFLPIFNPLSSLTKPITVEGYNEGKEFVPLIEIGYSEYREDKTGWNFRVANEWHKASQIEFSKALKLISWGFCPWESELDPNSWIDKGKLF